MGEQLIAAEWLLPMDSARPFCIEGGALWLRDGRIEAVGTREEVLALRRAAGFGEPVFVDEGPGQVLLPGFVNAHTHLFQSYLRGVHDDAVLEEWIRRVIWPWVEQIAYAFADQNYPRMLRETTDSVVAKLDHLRAQCAPHATHLRAGVGPNTLWGVSAPLYKLAGEYAAEHGLPMHCHVAETRLEVEYTLQHYGRRNVETLADWGLLRPGMQMVHCVWLKADEVALAAGTGAALVYCPTSNMYLASGAAPAWEAHQQGVPVMIGTDGPASNNSQDFLETLKMAACLAKVTRLDPTVMPARDLLHMATLGAAEQLGLGERCGSLTPGKEADVTRVDLRGLHCMPVHDPASSLVYNAQIGDVRDVWVGGRRLLRGGEGVRHDFAAEAARAQARIRELQPVVQPWDDAKLAAEGLSAA
ncbi:MAG: amidohydrolase family protein [Acidihalobacter sp.]|uniref:amidohydrolase family protein n=1 Tax=Acidihalobacter sp. TaxID=1872108 RepID=UPI00307D7018